MRSLRMPAIGATKIGITSIGSIRMPDCSGVRPSTVWKNCERKKIEPKTPKNIENDTTFVAENVRFLKKRSGSIGCGARPSQNRKRPSSTRPPTIPPSTTGLVQPSASARTIP